MSATDYPDSDSDSGSEYSVTQVQLAVSDGALESDDQLNPLVSRLGGHVAWLPTTSIPSSDIATCPHCRQPMELLVQIFAPLQESSFDRILLVWGCARAPCQSKGKGSVKAIRFLSYNARWEAKMQRKRQRREEKLALLEQQDKARKEEEATRKKTNPFASTANMQASGGLGGALFGNHEDAFSQDTKDKQDNLSGNEKDAGRKQHSLSSNEKDASHKKDVMSDEESEEDDEDDSMAEELAVKASLQDKRPEWERNDWSKDAPAYVPALYLSTFAEPSAAARQESEQKRNKAQLHKLKQDGLGEIKGWEAEKYESMMAANDPVFEKFVRRVGYHGKQLVRYEFGGVPIPFHAKGETYQRLWPKRKPAATLPGASSNANEYSAQSVLSCPKCGGRRVFELQLMPNLVNELRPSQIHGGADGEQNISAAGKEDAESKRRREIEEALGRKLPTAPDADGISRDPTDQEVQQGLARRTGIKWSTAMVFVCEADCHDSNISAENSWSEELVELQFEHDS